MAPKRSRSDISRPPVRNKRKGGLLVSEQLMQSSLHAKLVQKWSPTNGAILTTLLVVVSALLWPYIRSETKDDTVIFISEAWKVEDLPGRGKGVIATRDIQVRLPS